MNPMIHKTYNQTGCAELPNWEWQVDGWSRELGGAGRRVGSGWGRRVEGVVESRARETCWWGGACCFWMILSFWFLFPQASLSSLRAVEKKEREKDIK